MGKFQLITYVRDLYILPKLGNSFFVIKFWKLSGYTTSRIILPPSSILEGVLINLCKSQLFLFFIKSIGKIINAYNIQ